MALTSTQLVNVTSCRVGPVYIIMVITSRGYAAKKGLLMDELQNKYLGAVNKRNWDSRYHILSQTIVPFWKEQY